MEDIITNLPAQLWAIWMFIWFLIWTVNKNDKSFKEMNDWHRQERDEWRKQAIWQNEALIKVTKDTHSILAEMKWLLQK